MNPKIYVIPVKGREVFDPVRQDILPLEGRLVDRNPFWVRRLNDGDVTEKTKPTTKGAEK